MEEIFACRKCSRYLTPPNTWTYAEPGSAELLSLCLKKLRPLLSKLDFLGAKFIWTEPHSKRLKVELTVQKDDEGEMVQQSILVEFVVSNQTCRDCHRIAAKDYWRACVQIRQKCEYQRTLLYLQQLIASKNVHSLATQVKWAQTGIDYYFARQQDAKKLLEFVSSALPCRIVTSQQLVTHDPRNNVFDYKHTFAVDLVPIIKDCLICLERDMAKQFGNSGRFVLCLRVSSVMSLIDPSTLQVIEVNAYGIRGVLETLAILIAFSSAYWKSPFEILCQPKMMVEFYVLDVEESADEKSYSLEASATEENMSLISAIKPAERKYELGSVWVVRSFEIGKPDAQPYHCRTHLGRHLHAGDTVLGYDLANSNLNSAILDAMDPEDVPDVVLVRRKLEKMDES